VVNQRLQRSKVGWDRKFRTVMVVVFGLVGWLGLKAGLAVYAASQQAGQQTAIVQRLERQHRSLEARKTALSQPATIARDARHLGMVRVGEQAYVVESPSSAH
jgi:cell division protein FtsB